MDAAPPELAFEPREALVAGPTGLEAVAADRRRGARPPGAGRRGADGGGRGPGRGGGGRAGRCGAARRRQPRRPGGHRARRGRAGAGVSAAEDGLRRALVEGGVALVPTDTVYGLAAGSTPARRRGALRAQGAAARAAVQVLLYSRPLLDEALGCLEPPTRRAAAALCRGRRRAWSPTPSAATSPRPGPRRARLGSAPRASRPACAPRPPAGRHERQPARRARPGGRGGRPGGAARGLRRGRHAGRLPGTASAVVDLRAVAGGGPARLLRGGPTRPRSRGRWLTRGVPSRQDTTTLGRHPRELHRRRQLPLPGPRRGRPRRRAILRAEVERQGETLEMIASENFTSHAVLQAVGSVLTNKYAEGCRAGATTAAARSSTRSSSSRSTAPRRSSARPTSTSSRTPGGGQRGRLLGRDAARRPRARDGPRPRRPPLARLKVNFSGQLYDFHHYGVRREDCRIDMDQVRDMARELRPALIVAGASALPADHRLPGLPRDRRRGRARCSWWTWPTSPAWSPPGSAPDAGRDRRLGHDHDPQDPRRPARRHGDVQRGARREGGPGRLPGPPGRPADARDRRQGRRASARRSPRVPRPPGGDRPQLPRARRGAHGRRGQPRSAAAPTTTWCWWTSRRAAHGPRARSASSAPASPPTRTASRSTSARRP